MNFTEIFLLSVGLSMDAFAVSLCKGVSFKKATIKEATIIGLFFGGFQGLMPFLGWMAGISFKSMIESFDHWIAFFLLTVLGAKMIYDSIHEKQENIEKQQSLNIKELFILAVATSIDALAVGITFALLPNINIASSCSTIAVTTFSLSFIGVFAGSKTGELLKNKAEAFGGVILILIGLKIFLEHSGILII